MFAIDSNGLGVHGQEARACTGAQSYLMGTGDSGWEEAGKPDAPPTCC
jgi:hypothetical protein